MKTGSAGFTILELIVVFAILGLLAQGLSGGLGASLPAMRLKAATRILADDLRATRRAAILTQHSAVLTVKADSYQPPDVPAPRNLPAGVQLSLAAAPGGARVASQVRFFSDGSSSGGRLQLKLGNRYADVSVDWLTGRVNVDD